ncbi:MAG: sulfatase-like hydrolase/transferase [Proteobacteria bacterium]|nr:sulfatase-like hydrolase/transferase [Pseudomonadota bacterium]
MSREDHGPRLPRAARLMSPFAYSIGLALATLSALAAPGCSPAEEPGRLPVPHGVVLVSIDTLRADYLNTYGYTDFETSPFLDGFAAENVLFEKAFVSEPWTLTSHMTLFTGLHPHHPGVAEHTVLAEDVPTLALHLQRKGYRTQAFVDGGYVGAHWGFDRGFDAYETPRPLSGFPEILPRAMDWLDRHARESFFLFLHTYDVHSRGAMPYYKVPGSRAGTL